MGNKLFPIMLMLVMMSVATLASSEYGLMIDAGSTGTRIHLYRWPSRFFSQATSWLLPETYPISQEGWSEKISITLASYASHPKDVLELTNLLHAAGEKLLKGAGVSKDAYSSVPIYLGATAGMRVIPADQRDAIMNEARRLFHAGPFKFTDRFASIISGEEEGVYGFIAANYLKGKFTDSVSPSDSVGALDLGGASTQVTFGTSDTLLEGAWDLMGPNHARYYVYTHSYLYYGMEHWSNRVHNYVASGENIPGKPDVYSHPCLNKGRLMTFNTVVDTLDGPAVSRRVAFEGAGDYEACHALTLTVMNHNAPCWSKECSFSGVYMPKVPKTGSLVAFSTFPKVLETANLPVNDAPIEPQTIRSKATSTMCTLSWDELTKQFPDKDETYLSESCLSMTYLYTLLMDGYGFEPTSKQILFATQVQPEGHKSPIEVTWALGRMIYEANLLPYAVRLPSEKTVDAAIAMCIVLGIAVAVLSVLLYRERQRQREASGAYATLSTDDPNSIL